MKRNLVLSVIIVLCLLRSSPTCYANWNVGGGIAFGGYQTMLNDTFGANPFFTLKSYPLFQLWGAIDLTDKLEMTLSNTTYLHWEVSGTRGSITTSADNQHVSSHSYLSAGISAAVGSPVYLGLGITAFHEKASVSPEFQDLFDAIWDYFGSSEKPKSSSTQVRPHIKVGCDYQLTEDIGVRGELQMNYNMPLLAKIGITRLF